MIVYNVQRRWFTLKSDADTHRVSAGLKPVATAKIEVRDRDDLAALLNALCAPPTDGTDIVPTEVLDRAYVPALQAIPDCVPDFLLTDAQRRQRASQAGES